MVVGLERPGPRSVTHRLRYAETIAVVLSGLALTGMAFMITIDVGLRYLFDAPLPASVEISQLLEPYVIFLPMAYTLAIGRHVQVTVVTMLLPAWLQRLLQGMVLVIDLGFFAALTWFAWVEFYHSWLIDEIMLAAIKLPWWVGKFAMPLGLAVIVLECIVQLACVLRRTESTWTPSAPYETPGAEVSDCRGGA